MPYITLSDQVRKLHNPQRSDAFVKHLRTAVREGNVTAADISSRFELPKQYARRGSDESYTRRVRDMIIEVTPAFETWFEKLNRELSPTRAGGKVKVSAEAIEAGLVDFQALAAETRRRMGASFKKGQALGKSRTVGNMVTAATPKPTAKKTPAKRK